MHLFSTAKILTFQFQNGSIKSKWCVLYGENIQEFQFQNGSIKRWHFISWTIFYSKFQFQNGSIKSHLALSAFWLCAKFQFQNGSIKSNVFGKCEEVLFCFNSKMVRLKAYMPAARGALCIVSIPKWFD